MSASTPRPSFSRLAEYSALPISRLVAYADAAVLDAPAETEVETPLPLYWSGVIGMEGSLTGDGRLIEADALEWSTPIPMRFVKEDVGGHQNAVTVGRILSISRGEGGRIEAYGDFDHGSEDGREAARLVGNGVQNGVSMDLDSVAFEVRVAAEVIEEEDRLFEELMDGDGEAPEREIAEDGRVVVWKGGPDVEVMVTTEARVRAATIVSIPAFAEATIAGLSELPEEIMALVASAAPIDPPAEWFSVPEPDRPTALTITDDGQVYGHLATWDICHIADPNGAGVCVMAPKSKSGYSFFHTGVVKTSDGSHVPIGTIRFRTGHASLNLSADSAAAHYDHTGLAGADIRAIDGKHGIWVCGALRPGLSDEQVRELRAAPLSGDWRYIDGQLELVGALAVNLPGFPIPRTSGLVASGELTGLVAAGMVAPRRAMLVKQFTSAEAMLLKRLVERETKSEERALASRTRAIVNERKVAEMARKLPTLKKVGQ